MGNKLYIYESIVVVSGKDAEDFAYHLWHFACVFSSFEFSINGKEFSITTDAPTEADTPADKTNLFVLKFEELDRGNALRDASILNYILATNSLWDNSGFLPLHFVKK